MLDDIENEIENKKQYLKCDFDSNGKIWYFLIASDKNYNKIIGTNEYGPASELINIFIDRALTELYEVGTLFVYPDYQRHGIGTLLLNVMLLTFLNRGIKEFCLDSGYTCTEDMEEKIWRA